MTFFYIPLFALAMTMIPHGGVAYTDWNEEENHFSDLLFEISTWIWISAIKLCDLNIYLYIYIFINLYSRRKV